MSKFILLLGTLVSVQFSSVASAKDLLVYLIAKAPAETSTALVQSIETLSLSNCLQLANQARNIVIVQVHCNDMDDLNNALVEDIYPLLSIHLKSQWLEISN